MTIQERLEDTETALHIAQVDRNKWKARALKLAKFLGIRDCDIDDFDSNNATNGDVIEGLIELYQDEINKLEEERRADKGIGIVYAMNCGKIGAYGRVVADLKELLEEDDADE